MATQHLDSFSLDPAPQHLIRKYLKPSCHRLEEQALGTIMSSPKETMLNLASRRLNALHRCISVNV